MTRTLIIGAIVVVAIPALLLLAWVVHRILGHISVRHAQRFCRRSGLESRRARWQPEFERRPDGSRGVKTVYTLVQLDCLDAQKQRRLVLLSVSPFGIRRIVSIDPDPDSFDREWPQSDEPPQLMASVKTKDWALTEQEGWRFRET